MRALSKQEPAIEHAVHLDSQDARGKKASSSYQLNEQTELMKTKRQKMKTTRKTTPKTRQAMKMEPRRKDKKKTKKMQAAMKRMKKDNYS